MIRVAQKFVCVVILVAGFSAGAQAGPIIIVSGSAGTSEPGTTSGIVTNLTTLHEAVGNTVTVSSDIPADLTPFTQVWDIRFDDLFALTPDHQTQYLGFLQGGGGMFLMGENDSFMARNTSIFGFVALAGGGVLGPSLVGGCDGPQDVQSPFTGPNPVSNVDFACSGVIESNGTGEWIAVRSNLTGGSGVAWGVGDLGNAPAGALTTVFDVNFMQNNPVFNDWEDMQALTKNLINFVGEEVEEVPTAVPEPTSMLLLGTGIAAAAARRRRSRK